MSATVRLTITEGTLEGQTFIFRERVVTTAGRSSACHLQLTREHEHCTLSRRHCLLDIDPPSIRVRDLGSRNGTYVNGRNIGCRDYHLAGGEIVRTDWLEHPLQAGDEVRVGNTVF